MAAQKSPPNKITKPKPPRAKPAPKAAPQAELEVLSFENARAFERWLKTHHGESRGIWLRLMKKTATSKGVSYQEALGVAISWGWIDGHVKKYDAESWIRKFSPRASRSKWSKINRDKALALIAAKQMHPAGLEQVERAKADGRWQAAYDSPSNATPPPDLARALAASPRAAEFFERLNGANRYAVLYRVQTPKKAETRARKIRELVAMLERGEKIHP
jgi:uncharacterized protein YdeI (YjbR/CyaY-like superfamily)